MKKPKDPYSAQKKYMAKNMKRVIFDFNTNTRPLMCKYLMDKENRSAYLRSLILRDMKERGEEIDLIDQKDT